LLYGLVGVLPGAGSAPASRAIAAAGGGALVLGSASAAAFRWLHARGAAESMPASPR
jgi:hypothetical protein